MTEFRFRHVWASSRWVRSAHDVGFLMLVPGSILPGVLVLALGIGTWPVLVWAVLTMVVMAVGDGLFRTVDRGLDLMARRRTRGVG